MIPNITRGASFAGVTAYLVDVREPKPNRKTGEVRRSNVHKNPHVVAGDMDLFMAYAGRELRLDDAATMARELDESRLLMGTRVTALRTREEPGSGLLVKESVDAHVWHCSLSLAAEEGQLSDERWNQIATEFVDAMGFTAESGKAECRWVAIRHGLSEKGNDHVHIAVSLVRTDGTKASVHNDFARAQQACRDLEVKHGLAVTGDRAAELGTRGSKPPAIERAERLQLDPEVVRLARTVRAAAASSSDEAEFVRRARQAGLLIRPRFATGRDDVVEGYSIAVRPEPGKRVIWHGGGRVARDLTLPRLRAAWPDEPLLATEAVDEWRAAARGLPQVHPGRETAEPNPDLWLRYAADMRAMRLHLAEVPLDDRGTWAAVAKEQAGVFAAWSQQLDPVAGAAATAVSDELARTAQIRAHDSRLRAPRVAPVARGLAAALSTATLPAGSAVAQLVLLDELIRASQAIADMVRARGDLRRSEQMEATLRKQLGTIRAALQTPAGAQEGGAAAAVDPQRPGSPDPLGRRRPPLATDQRRPGIRSADDQTRDTDRGLDR